MAAIDMGGGSIQEAFALTDEAAKTAPKVGREPEHSWCGSRHGCVCGWAAAQGGCDGHFKSASQRYGCSAVVWRHPLGTLLSLDWRPTKECKRCRSFQAGVHLNIPVRAPNRICTSSRVECRTGSTVPECAPSYAPSSRRRRCPPPPGVRDGAARRRQAHQRLRVQLPGVRPHGGPRQTD